MYGRKVDVAVRQDIEFGENQLRKKLIIDSLEIIYESH